MRNQFIGCLILIAIGISGCRPGPLGNNLVRDDNQPFVDGTQGEKPIRCYFGACGSWRAPEQAVGRSVVSVSISLAANQFTRRVACQYPDGSTRIAQVIVKAAVTSNEIIVLQNEVARDPGPSGQPPCESRVEKTRVKYSLQNRSTLMIHQPNGQTASWEKDLTSD